MASPPDAATLAAAAHPTLPAPPAMAAPATPTQLMLQMPVDVRNMSLALLALFAGVALLHWASAVFIPLMLSLLLTTALRPAVNILRRWHLPRPLGAALLLIAIVGGMASMAWSLSDQAVQLVDSLPVAAKKVRDNLRARAGMPSTLDTMQKAAAQIEQAAAENSAATPRGAACSAWWWSARPSTSATTCGAAPWAWYRPWASSPWWCS